jgi:hypothetical protein
MPLRISFGIEFSQKEVFLSSTTLDIATPAAGESHGR